MQREQGMLSLEASLPVFIIRAFLKRSNSCTTWDTLQTRWDPFVAKSLELFPISLQGDKHFTSADLVLQRHPNRKELKEQLKDFPVMGKTVQTLHRSFEH
jgi:hypothetical protein